MTSEFLANIGSLIVSAAASQAAKEAVKALKAKFANSFVLHSTDFSEAMQSYYEYLLSKTEKVILLALKKNEKELEDIYVPLKIERNTDRKSFVLNMDVNKFVESSSRQLILDKAGMGKSTITKWIARRLAKTGGKMPVLIEYRRLTDSHGILAEMQRQLSIGSRLLSSELISKALEIGGFVILLDGADEIASKDRSSVLRDTIDFMDTYSNNSYIVTSRPMDSLDAIQGFDIYRIKPLSKVEAYSLLRKFDNSGGMSAAIVEELKKPQYTAVLEYLETPLLVGMLFSCYSYKQTIPLSRQLFYRQIYEALFECHDLTKELGWRRVLKTNLDLEGFRSVTRKLAAITYSKGTTEFQKDEILTFIDSAKKACIAEQFKSGDFLEDISTHVPLLAKDGFHFFWPHKSLQEYFCVDYVKEELLGQRKAFLAKYSLSHRTHENILVLAWEMMPNEYAEVITLPLLKEYLSHLKQVKNACTWMHPAEAECFAYMIFGTHIAFLKIPKAGINMSNLPSFHAIVEKQLKTNITNYSSYSSLVIYGKSSAYGLHKAEKTFSRDMLVQRYPELLEDIPKHLASLKTDNKRRLIKAPFVISDSNYLSLDPKVTKKVFFKMFTEISRDVVKYIPQSRIETVIEKLEEQLIRSSVQPGTFGLLSL